MRTLWKGAISFGLVNIPVKLYTAVDEKDIKFRYLHSKCNTPIKYEKRCPVCDVSVAQEDIVMGYEYENGKYVIMKEEDLHRIPAEGARTIDILDFVALEEIDPIYFDRSYYLEPNAGGEKAYALLKRTMRETRRIAIAKVMIRSKSALACLRVQGDVVVMETMFFPDEIRSPEGLTGITTQPRLTDAEVKLANELVTNLTSKFDASKYTDDYRGRLMEVIQAKVAGAEVAIPQQAQEGGKVIDLMDALKASLAATSATSRKGKKAQTG